MKVVVLGTAAGGGFPQWNCACSLCAKARNGSLPSRAQDCVAVSGNGSDWWLLNASPDIRVQVVGCAALTPGPGRRDTPVRGVLLTSAELDHCLGVFSLREGGGQHLYAPANALAALRSHLGLRDVLDLYAGWSWSEAVPEKSFALAGGLIATPHAVGTKRPKYAPELPGPWVVAYRVHDPSTGGTLLYAPCLASWSAGFEALLDGVDCLLLDGTFSAPDEMGVSTGHSKGQSSMGHVPVFGGGGSLAQLRRFPVMRRIYTHLNNTNPLLDPASPESAEITAAGIEVVPDGTVITL
ncbi:pyrroloquinoline quinone biosynthesis protein PqqB [Kutzneria kofuensis]|uniref:Coenzyme PQQ synthesis protein B n=1 Tax=Kutzneria kofuensis TaxID=103725 RepID=A0A7W9KGH6_9PSEU|nr:pyrroloquinoline quinone biosynthesis protein PqqB [Kutzneria kofuensis]MBB5891768.1 pyrroloquinoline quinone biosynthesis protein B [Kutzneria kofuensis]